MIAKLDSPFTRITLDRKINYHDKKIVSGKAELLYSSLNYTSLDEFRTDCLLIEQSNLRVKNHYNEVTLNLPPGEKLSDSSFLQIAFDYLKYLGYSDVCYSIIKHTDKEQHCHLHILFTTVDYNGKHVKDSNIRFKSQETSRFLEEKYQLRETTYNKFTSKSLSENNARKFFFDNAFMKALKSPEIMEQINPLIKDTIFAKLRRKGRVPDHLYKHFLGEERYNQIGSIFQKAGLIKPLFKDELLNKIESAYSRSHSLSDFRSLLDLEGVYMRFVTDNKNKAKYIYGLKDVSFYMKDSSLPQKFRYGNLNFQNENLTSKNTAENDFFINLQAMEISSGTHSHRDDEDENDLSKRKKKKKKKFRGLSM